MALLRPKISVIGCGNVGMRYAYATIIQGIARELVLVDIDRTKLEGEVMDLDHGAPFYPPVKIVAGDYSDIVDSDVVVITAGKNIIPGQTRLDIAKENVLLFKEIIPNIMRFAPHSIFLVVTNPVDIMTYAAYKISKKSSHQVMGSGTVLDSARFRFLLSKQCKVAAQNIHAYVLGEHGDSEFPVWSSAMIGGVLFKDYCMVCKRHLNCECTAELQGIYEKVKNAGYEIVKRKHETSYGIGMALAKITTAIVHNENAILPVSAYLDDYMDINDVYLSVPAVVNSSGIREVLTLKFDPEEAKKLKASAHVVKYAIRDLEI